MDRRFQLLSRPAVDSSGRPYMNRLNMSLAPAWPDLWRGVGHTVPAMGDQDMARSPIVSNASVARTF